MVRELAHLRHRSHGPDFWRFLGVMLPNVDEPRRWLELHEAGLGSEFLSLTGETSGVRSGA